MIYIAGQKPFISKKTLQGFKKKMDVNPVNNTSFSNIYLILSENTQNYIID